MFGKLTLLNIILFWEVINISSWQTINNLYDAFVIALTASNCLRCESMNMLNMEPCISYICISVHQTDDGSSKQCTMSRPTIKYSILNKWWQTPHSKLKQTYVYITITPPKTKQSTRECCKSSYVFGYTATNFTIPWTSFRHVVW